MNAYAVAYEDLADTQGRAEPVPQPAFKRAFDLTAALRDQLRRLSAAALDLVFPPTCLACRKATAGHGALCPACWGRINFGPIAKGSARPFPMISASTACIPPKRSPIPRYARARAVARFEEGRARTLVHRLKYSDRTELAGPLGLWMARAGR